MYQDVQIVDYLEIVNQKLARGGVFLTTQNQSKLNTMTIGWGGITHFWAKPIFIVPVRKSRYTYQLIDQAGEFTVSVPIENNLSQQLRFCGTNSGRDIDKFAAAGLTTLPGKLIQTPLSPSVNCILSVKLFTSRKWIPNTSMPVSMSAGILIITPYILVKLSPATASV